MGMGDYDKRLAAYCRMFVEDVGEEELISKFQRDGSLNNTELCRAPCSSPASGASGDPDKQRRPRPRPRRPTPPTPPPVPPRPKTMKPPPPPPRGRTSVDPGAATPRIDALEQAVGLLPRLSTLQLQWLGEAVLKEL